VDSLQVLAAVGLPKERLKGAPGSGGGGGRGLGGGGCLAPVQEGPKARRGVYKPSAGAGAGLPQKYTSNRGTGARRWLAAVVVAAVVAVVCLALVEGGAVDLYIWSVLGQSAGCRSCFFCFVAGDLVEGTP
jgi:hypothetical protein